MYFLFVFTFKDLITSSGSTHISITLSHQKKQNEKKRKETKKNKKINKRKPNKIIFFSSTASSPIALIWTLLKAIKHLYSKRQTPLKIHEITRSPAPIIFVAQTHIIYIFSFLTPVEFRRRTPATLSVNVRGDEALRQTKSSSGFSKIN